MKAMFATRSGEVNPGLAVSTPYELAGPGVPP